MKLPVYKLIINEDDEIKSGVDFIALVDEPAIMQNWQAFSEGLQRFQIKDREKRLISGPAMIPNLQIYRFDEQMGEYYTYFDRPTIEKIVYKFFRSGMSGNVNLMHDSDRQVEDVYLVESMIIDSNRGIITPKGWSKLPEGTWFVTMRVDDDGIWQDFVKTGVFKGFSIEGMFEHVFMNEVDDSKLHEIIDLLIASEL